METRIKEKVTLIPQLLWKVPGMLPGKQEDQLRKETQRRPSKFQI